MFNENDVQQGRGSTRMIFKGEMEKKLLPPCWLTPPRCEQLSPDQDFAIAASDQLSFEKIPIGANLIFNKTGAPWFIENGGISEKTSFISCTKIV